MAFSRLPISRVGSSNPFFINLLRLNRPIPVVHPFAATVPSAPMVAATRSIVARSIYTVDLPTECPDDETLKARLEYFKLLERSKHPFIRVGPPSPVFCVEDDDKVYMRTDMPGVGKEGLKFWAEKDRYVFEGVESVDDIDDDEDQDEEKRVYTDILWIDTALVVKDSINIVVQNGVLRIVFRLRSLPKKST